MYGTISHCSAETLLNDEIAGMFDKNYNSNVSALSQEYTVSRVNINISFSYKDYSSFEAVIRFIQVNHAGTLP